MQIVKDNGVRKVHRTVSFLPIGISLEKSLESKGSLRPVRNAGETRYIYIYNMYVCCSAVPKVSNNYSYTNSLQGKTYTKLSRLDAVSLQRPIRGRRE